MLGSAVIPLKFALRAEYVGRVSDPAYMQEVVEIVLVLVLPAIAGFSFASSVLRGAVCFYIWFVKQGNTG